MSLRERTIIIKNGHKELHTGLILEAEYNHNEGTVTIEISKKLKPYLLQLKSNFTQYELEYVLKLQSFYSIRIYELLKQYEKLEQREIEIIRLKEILGITDKYKRYNALKDRVIEPAQQEIKIMTDIYFKYKEIKTGRKITAIKFYIYNNEKNQENKEHIKELITGNEKNKEQNSKTKQAKQMLLKYKIDKRKIAEYLEKKDPEKIIKTVQEAEKNDSIKNKAGFIVSALTNDWNIEEPAEQKSEEKKALTEEEIDKIIEQHYNSLSAEEKQKISQILLSDKNYNAFLIDGNFQLLSAYKYYLRINRNLLNQLIKKYL
jgi:plasmid replication initiation protein